jgi:hypothetical protein
MNNESTGKVRKPVGVFVALITILAAFNAYVVIKALLRAARNPWPDLSPWVNLSQWLDAAAGGLLLLVILSLLYRLMRSLAKGDPHDPANPRRVRSVALAAFGIIVANLVFTGLRFLLTPWESSWSAWTAVLVRDVERLVFILGFLIVARLLGSAPGPLDKGIHS